ncbi:hypothetical protein [Thermaerobacter subterraneus]|uniref:Uncharacterized protein n=1 Tax=Thermaerobacter subterraneus DSM 13965 TaxID=867903 RepID=K6PQ81_9FIRM|nr:hypothetical protein [Thermaerobacter subterraneus]EKP95087.1 hypothetical protein ThesuDRAFT_00816 [Thermaerobacter subterraneus DSM 13965]
MTWAALGSLLAGTLLGIPAWIVSIGSAIAGWVTRRAGWVYAAALFAIGPLCYFALTPRFQYVAPVGILLAIAAIVVLRRKGDIRVAAALAALPLALILLTMGANGVVTLVR